MIFVLLPHTRNRLKNNMEYQIINGKILKQADALIPINDLGMLRGYGVFDYFRVLDGRPVFMAEHIERLFHSLDVLDIELDFERHHIKDMVLKLVEKNNVKDAGFRIVVTGGFAEDGYNPDDQPNLFMMMHSLPTYDPEDYEKGVKLISTAYLRDIPSVKTIIYVQVIHFAKKMKAEGAMEVLYHWKDNMTECSRSNIFFIDYKKRLVTPSHGMLKGITRLNTIKIAERMGMEVELRKVNMDEIDGMEEAFITSSTKGIMPVVQIDDTIIGDGVPGEITEQLMAAFAEEVEQYLAVR
jgi:D-alanine transaminase/branched-chain amino acid aminotransferase